jgi:hypothetical protein
MNDKLYLMVVVCSPGSVRTPKIVIFDDEKGKIFQVRPSSQE